VNSLKLWTQCCLKNHPSHSQKKRCVVILTCRVIFPKYHRIKVNKKKCQNVVNNYQARVILRPIPNVSESAFFLLMTSGLFFPASFTIQAICQGPRYTFGQTAKILGILTKKASPVPSRPASKSRSKQLLSIQAATQIFIILPVTWRLGFDGTRGSWMFFSPWWSFVKERIWEKGPLPKCYPHTPKNEWVRMSRRASCSEAISTVNRTTNLVREIILRTKI